MAVSHQLDKLRAITGGPLFVKSGRGIVATARAQQLGRRGARSAAPTGAFRPRRRLPARWQATVTIAANDFQRDVLLPALAQRLREAAPGVVLRIIPSDVPSLEMLARPGVGRRDQPPPARGQRHPAAAHF